MRSPIFELKLKNGNHCKCSSLLAIPRSPLTVARSISAVAGSKFSLTAFEFSAVQTDLASMRTKGHVSYTDPSGSLLIDDGTVDAGDLTPALQALPVNFNALLVKLDADVGTAGTDHAATLSV